jgi:hypothetical protein
MILLINKGKKIYIYIIYTLYLTFTNNTGTAWLSPPRPMYKYQLSKCSGRQVLKEPLTKLTIVHISNIKKKTKKQKQKKTLPLQFLSYVYK